jgi:hypothetical protein
MRVFGYRRRPSRSRRHCDLDTSICNADPLCDRHRCANGREQRGTDSSADCEPYADEFSDVGTNCGTEP